MISNAGTERGSPVNSPRHMLISLRFYVDDYPMIMIKMAYGLELLVPPIFFGGVEYSFCIFCTKCLLIVLVFDL